MQLKSYNKLYNARKMTNLLGESENASKEEKN